MSRQQNWLPSWPACARSLTASRKWCWCREISWVRGNVIYSSFFPGEFCFSLKPFCCQRVCVCVCACVCVCMHAYCWCAQISLFQQWSLGTDPLLFHMGRHAHTDAHTFIYACPPPPPPPRQTCTHRRTYIHLLVDWGYNTKLILTNWVTLPATELCFPACLLKSVELVKICPPGLLKSVHLAC